MLLNQFLFMKIKFFISLKANLEAEKLENSFVITDFIFIRNNKIIV